MSYQPTFGPLNPSVAQWLTGTAVPFGAGHLAGTAYHRQAFFARHRRAVDFIDHPAHFVSDKQVAQNLDFKFRYEAGGGFSTAVENASSAGVEMRWPRRGFQKPTSCSVISSKARWFARGHLA